MSATPRYRPNPNVVATQVEGGEQVLLDLTTMRYYSINPTGAAVWAALGEGLDIPATAERLTERFTVSAEAAGTFVAGFLAELAGEGLVERVDR